MLVPGVQRPHPTFGDVVPLFDPSTRSIVLLTIILLSMSPSRLVATLFGSKSSVGPRVNAIMADLILILSRLLLITTLTPLPTLLKMHPVPAGSGSFEIPVSGVVSGIFVVSTTVSVMGRDG